MYHRNKIDKGIIGNFSKITEEYQELLDAHDQEDKILQIIELTDLIGAIELFAENKFKLSLDDLITFSKKTINSRRHENQ